jgi:glycosyltransferase involved in cell wall biosynthesis
VGSRTQKVYQRVTNTLLILHDSPDFGGHERMLLALLPGLIASRRFDRIAFTVPRSNVRLAAALAPLAPDVVVIACDNLKRRAEPYLRFVRFGYQRVVARLIASERPSTILLVQGRIENLASALWALPRNVRVISYIPMAHSMRAMGRSGLIGDRIRRALYRRPDSYVVPSNAVARQLRTHGVTVPIAVAHNTVAPPPRTDRAQARRDLGLPSGRRLALVLGRLDTAQKGIDRLFTAIERTGPEQLANWSFVLVGDGPGRAIVDAATARLPTGTVLSVPWTDRPDLYLSAADILVMPSRWEGMPLSMLEAIAYNLPVLASRIDAFCDFLPPEQITDFERDDLAVALARAVDPARRASLAAAAENRVAPLTLEHAHAAFVGAFVPDHDA